MNLIKKKHLVFTGGGSGGHSYTAIAIYSALKLYDKGKIDYSYIGSINGIEKNLAFNEGIKYHYIPTGKLRRYFSIKNFIDFIHFFRGIIKAFFILKKIKTNLVISTGGFVSLPVVIAAWALRIPILIHEQTSRVGLANKIASFFASLIMVSFSSAKNFFKGKKVIHTGQPLRKDLFQGNKERCYNRYNFDKKLPILYITGGSQGSLIINKNILPIINTLTNNMNIIHQCGKGNYLHQLNNIKNQMPKDKQNRYIIKEFIESDEIRDILFSCFCLLGRSGALTVSEVIQLKIPSIFIPLRYATKNEQYHNARIVENIGSAIIIKEKDISSKKIQTEIESLLLNKKKYQKMKNCFDSNVNNKIIVSKYIAEIILNTI